MFVAPNNAIGQNALQEPAVQLRARHHADRRQPHGSPTSWWLPPDLPVKTVAEFIAYAKANPGKLTPCVVRQWHPIGAYVGASCSR